MGMTRSRIAPWEIDQRLPVLTVLIVNLLNIFYATSSFPKIFLQSLLVSPPPQTCQAKLLWNKLNLSSVALYGRIRITIEP